MHMNSFARDLRRPKRVQQCEIGRYNRRSRKSFRIPDYLHAVVRSFLRNRKLFYETREELWQIPDPSGAAQRSILGLDLLNIGYDYLQISKWPKSHI